MYNALSLEEIYEKLNSNPNGLSEEEAKEKIKIYGKNEIKIKKRNFFIEAIKDELKNYFLWVFIFTVIISIILHKIIESYILIFFILVYILFDIIYKYRTDKVVESLKKINVTETIVIRDGIERKIDSRYLVPGDIVILKSGSKVPADIRIIDGYVEVDESILTGESEPVRKGPGIIKTTDIHYMKNMLFYGTYIIKGYCRGIVVETGNNTYLGKLYKKLEEKRREKSILEQELDRFARIITFITLFSIAIVFILSITLNIFNLYDSLLYALAIGIAVVPEGLPTALVVIYGIAIDNLSKKKVLIKYPALIETLGAIDTIFTDKTGTLTYNQFVLREFWYNGNIYKASGKGYEIKGEIYKNNEKVNKEEIKEFIEACLNSIDTKINFNENEIEIIGDPLEAAMIIFAKKAGYEKYYKVLKINEFDQMRRRMSVLVERYNKKILYVKGAPESILEISRYIKINNKIENIEEYKKLILEEFNRLAEEGYKVLAIGYKEGEEEKDIIFLGLLAFEDPLREDVKEAIDYCKESGIDIYILTGDHPKTTVSYAKKLGIGTEYITGEEMKKYSDKELYILLKNRVKIIARATPEDKYRIVKIFKENGHIIGFIGDGINDSIAINEANAGVTIKDASDITKDAAGIILLDPDYKNFINAIEEGRKIFYSLKIYIITLLSINLGIFASVLLSFTIYKQIFLSAFAILFLNVLVETLFSLSVSYADVDESLIKRKVERRILKRRTILGIIRNSILIGVSSLVVALSTFGNIYSILLFFILSKILLFYYYQIKYKVYFIKSPGFIFAAIFSLLLINIAFLSTISKLLQIMPPRTILDILIPLIVSAYFFATKIVLYKIEGQPVPELHHYSANSDLHH